MVLLMALIPSCRNAKQAKTGYEIAKKLSGKVIKSSEKAKYVSRYGDDVVRRIEFVEIDCPVCNGTGYDTWGYVCEECAGDGHKTRIQMK